MKHTELKPGNYVWAWYKDYNRPEKLELYFGIVATVGKEYCTVRLFHDEEPSENPKRPFGIFHDVCTADITEVITLPSTPSPLPETETGVSIDTPTEAREVFEYLDGPDGNFASEPAPEGWETGTPPTPGNEREGEGFTPGPWKCKPISNRVTNNNRSFEISGFETGNSVRDVLPEEVEATARLIASAPDMFWQLKLMSDKIENGWDWNEQDVTSWSYISKDILNSITGGK